MQEITVLKTIFLSLLRFPFINSLISLIIPAHCIDPPNTMAEITSQIVFNIPLIPEVLSNELSELFSVIIEKLVVMEDIIK